MADAAVLAADHKPAADPKSSLEATRGQLIALRDAFVAQAARSSIPCAIEPPAIVVQDVPSYGSYDPDTNTLTSPAWEQLSRDEQALFYGMLAPGAEAAEARAEFEIGVHRWVIVHELGHWWEACRGWADHGDHYEFELQADRIAAAYWNEHDPSVISHQQQVFAALVKHRQSPVPAGQSAARFFNTNYEALGPTVDYIWFQAQMCLSAFEQKPIPRFAATLATIAGN